MEIELLQEERLRYWCGRIDIPQGAADALAGVAHEILDDPTLLEVFTNFYVQTTINGGWMQEWGDLPFDPAVQEKLGDRASLFYLLGYLAALPKAEREYRRLGVSLEIFHDTMLDFAIWLNQAYDLKGYWNFNQFAWMALHMACKLFRLGRLQFMLAEFQGKVTAFRHRQTGSILLLGDPTLPLRADGYAEGAGGKPPAEGETWHAVFEKTPAGWRGNRITPQGYTLREESFLLRSEWERVLAHGDTILDLHIPRGDKLTVKACRESIQAAYAFFPEIFPDRPFKGLSCHTWFFTPQLQKILPPESNIVRFQREFYLFPYPGTPEFLWGFVFGDKYPDATTAPRDTSLRRSVLDWLAAGNELFDLPGLMLHTPDQWGTQPYYNIQRPEPAQTAAPILPAQNPMVFPLLEPLLDDADDSDYRFDAAETETTDDALVGDTLVLSEYTETDIAYTGTLDDTDDTDDTGEDLEDQPDEEDEGESESEGESDADQE